MRSFFLPAMVVAVIAANEADRIKNNQPFDGYCMKTISAKSVVMHNGAPLKTQVVLDNGTLLKPDGIVMRKNGYRFLLNEGECLLQDGTLIGD